MNRPLAYCLRTTATFCRGCGVWRPAATARARVATAANGVALHCTEHRGQEFTSRKMLRVMARAWADAVQASSNAHS
jgi:hypothetical protein